MNLEAKLREIQNIEIAKLETHSCSSLGEVLDNCLKPMLPKPEVILGWHELLMRYIERPEAIFFLRRFASHKDYAMLRRGFLTEYNNGLGYVFCDNSLANYIYALALDDYVPDDIDFFKVVTERRFPYGYFGTSAEAPFQAFPKGASPRINKMGWKLSHVYSVNGSDYSVKYRTLINDYFPRGLQDEWGSKDSGKYPHRKVSREINNEELSLLTAHFLRFIHPLNHFLSPVRKHQDYSLGSDIGEDKAVVRLIGLINKERYSEAYEEYLEKIMPSGPQEARSCDELRSIAIDFKCGLSVNKTGKTATHVNISEEDTREMAWLYLEKGASFRALEKEVLGIDSKTRGGGFVAKATLNAFGIEAAHKKMLANTSIEKLISESAGPFKTALEEMQKYRAEKSL